MLSNKLPKRKHPRLKQYDYSVNGYYFVTICCKDMKCFFGKITHIADNVGLCFVPNERVYADTELTLSPYGQIAEKQLLELEKRYDYVTIDKYVIMPNHIHAILILDGEAAGASLRPTLRCNTGKGPTFPSAPCLFRPNIHMILNQPRLGILDGHPVA